MINRIVLLSLLIHTAAVSAYLAICDATPVQVYPPSNLTLGGVPCHQDIYHTIVTFGDSWTDNGQGPIVADIYKTGPFSGRQTNGPTWVEYLSLFMGADTYGFSYSGATANNTIAPRGAPDVFGQMALFQQSKAVPDSEFTLYTVWIGVNDIHDIYTNQSVPGQKEKLQLVSQVVDAVEYETRYVLSTFKVQHLVILGLAPIYHLPLFLDVADTTDLQQLVTEYNNGLQALAEKHSVRYIDTTPLFEKYLANEDNTFADTTLACAGSSKKEVQAQCASTNFNFLWWDDWHPTTKAHGMIASDIFHILHT